MYDIDAKGVQRTRAAIVNVGKRAEDVRPVFADVKKVVQESNAARFDSRGEGTWPALKASTRQAKRRKGQDPRVMRASGALYKSLTAARGKGQVNRKKPDLFRMGTKLFYAQFHDRGDGGVPKRQLIDLQADDMRRINNRLEHFIAEGEQEIQSLL